MSSRQRTLGHAAALMTILIWGTTFVSTKVLLRDFTPVTVLFTRFVIGYAFLWCLKPRFLPFSGWKKEFLFAGAGLTGVTLYFLLENIALTYTFASNVGIIVAVVPFFTALLAHFLLKGEGFSRRFFLGFAAAFTGIFLIMANGAFVLELNPAGDILALGAAFVWAAYSILMKKIGVNTSNMIICTRRIFFYGIALMIPALWLLPANMDWHLMVKPVNAFNLLYLGLFASALCFLTWNRVVEILGAVKSSIYIYMVPVVAVVASAIILGERLTWISLTGILLTLCGVTISEYRKKNTEKRKEKAILRKIRFLPLRFSIFFPLAWRWTETASRTCQADDFPQRTDIHLSRCGKTCLWIRYPATTKFFEKNPLSFRKRFFPPLLEFGLPSLQSFPKGQPIV